VLVGRDSERAAVVALLDQARVGRGAGLVLRGLPGVGKSALMDDAVSMAEGLMVLRTSGIESESPLAVAASAAGNARGSFAAGMGSGR